MNEHEIDQFLTELKSIYSGSDLHDSGIVFSCTYSVAVVYGLNSASINDEVEFSSGSTGIVLMINESFVKVIIFGKTVHAKDIVKMKGRKLSIPSGDDVISRVLDALGRPIDGLGSVNTSHLSEVYSPAPPMIKRQSISEPLETGTKSIDALIPIGRGQRQLIIGDRGTCKTTICIDAIINQKHMHDINHPNRVYCVYVSIGQRRSEVASIINLLKEKGAMSYTTIVAATASDGAPYIYIAPYAGCAIAERLRDNGKHVLIIYDDISKHQVACREISYALGKSPARDSYPADAFYLSSSLLERAANLKHGSLTALPIVETQAGDISSYIPTNVISITDGQIFLERDLFNNGITPPINVRLSVSRVGGNAQSKIVRKMSNFKLMISQADEIKKLSVSGSELDESSMKILINGEKITKLMMQEAHNPASKDELCLIMRLINKYIDKFSIDRIESILNLFKEKSIALYDIDNEEEYISMLDKIIESCLN